MIKLLGKVPDNINVAVSGGVDSMAVLDFLNNGRRNITVLHFNHGTPHGYEAKKFVRNYCFTRGIGLLDERIRREKRDDESLEEYWRTERYDYFKRHSHKPIVTAHHLDDVAEWWIMSALHGDAKVTPYMNPDYNVIRPFLLTPKAELESWAEKKKVPFIEDPSNCSRNHMRNVVRHDMIPTAKIINPGLHKTMRKKVQAMYDMQQKYFYKKSLNAV